VPTKANFKFVQQCYRNASNFPIFKRIFFQFVGIFPKTAILDINITRLFNRIIKKIYNVWEKLLPIFTKALEKLSLIRYNDGNIFN
jgi:hypothetical protein